jgi:hypothetical protein
VIFFLPFDQWELENGYFPIREEIGQGLHEIILTTEISKFLFDLKVEEVAFVFIPEQLEEYRAILQGIDNTFLCCFNQKGLKKVVTKTLLSVFPSKHDNLLCPVTHCYTSKIFHDLENLRKSCKVMSIPPSTAFPHSFFFRELGLFSIEVVWESWDYLVLKLCGGMGLTLHLYDEQTSKY